MTIRSAPAQSDDLVEQVTQHLITALVDGRWHLVSDLRGCIPDALADARLALTRPIVYQDQSDPREFGRLLLVQDAIKQLIKRDQVDHRPASDGKDEVRLDPSVVPVPSKHPVTPKSIAPTTPSVTAPAAPTDGDPPLVEKAGEPDGHPQPTAQPTLRTSSASTAPEDASVGDRRPIHTQLPIDQIQVGPRHRKDLGDLSNLAASIDRLGLLQVILVTSDHQLISGKRRLEAMKCLGRKQVPVAIVNYLDDALQLLRRSEMRIPAARTSLPARRRPSAKRSRLSNAPRPSSVSMSAAPRKVVESCHQIRAKARPATRWPRRSV